MKIIAIIVNYYTSGFLPPLLKILQNENEIDEIIVADNGDKATLKNVISEFAKIHLLTFDKNVGFGAAVNRAAKKYTADYYLLINPDTLPEAGFAEKLIEGAKASNALITGPRFYWDNKKSFKLPPAMGNAKWLQNGMDISQQSIIDAKLFSFDWTLRHERFWNATDPFFEPFLSGACLLIKNDKSFFGDGKIFDERFFLYYEDTDLCMKALLHEKTMVCVPNAEVVHYWDQSPSEDKGKFMAESHQKFFEKYYGSGLRKCSESTSQKDAEVQMFDLGEFSTPPLFQTKTTNEKDLCYFEIGINPFFVPFAQTELSADSYEIPKEIWDNLTAGVYFSRLRNQLNKTIAVWKWKKY